MKSFESYSGTWSDQTLRTLLNRTLMGYTNDQWNAWKDISMEKIVINLTAPQPLPNPPVNPGYEEDPYVKVGETWVDKPYPRRNNDAVRMRRLSLISYVMGQIVENKTSIYPNMILFWHNHFPIEKINDQRFNYDYHALLNENALGNFKQLTLEMTLNPAMLRYLNGNQNTARNPNENFARELLELFTIGKGELAGEGDYTNYTEQDVQAIAKCLTGWRDYGYYKEDTGKFGAFFRTNQHDKSTKILSPRFDSIEIPNLEEEEYKRVIDIIFEKKEVARFISRKLFRWFVGSEIDEEVEKQVIHPMGEYIYNSGYEIRPAIEQLLVSEVFYDAYYCGAIIKNPLMYLSSLYHHISFALNEGSQRYFQSYRSIFFTSNLLGMSYFNVPQVAGWKAYYQGPAWTQHWINTTTLADRNEHAQRLLNINTRFDENFGADMLSVIENFDNPGDPNELIRELTLFMLPKPLSEEQITNLKEFFIPGLPDYEWTSEYNQYLQDLSDEKLRRSLNDKLKLLAYNIISLPDYQVI